MNDSLIGTLPAKDLPPPRQLVDLRKLYSAGVPLRCHGLNGHPQNAKSSVKIQNLKGSEMGDAD